MMLTRTSLILVTFAALGLGPGCPGPSPAPTRPLPPPIAASPTPSAAVPPIVPTVIPTVPLPTASSTPAAPTSVPTSAPVPTAAPAVRTWETTITIPTYQYQAALHPDPAGRIPYPQLDFAQMGPPAPQAYRAVMVENRYLTLTFLPDLGGRLYRCVFRPTGQDVFYRNPVIKPTHWGPDEMGWWIAAGGIEWCFPVWEHGYTTALPWQCRTQREKDGSVTFVAEDDEDLTGLHIAVAVTLRPDRADFEVQPTVSNPTGQSQTYKLWINALLSLGADPATTQFALPIHEAIVHSTGDETLPRAGERMSWPIHNGRDFSRYANWTHFLGVFAAPAPTWAGAYDTGRNLGLVRLADPAAAPGVKLFAFGPDQDPTTYTDGDSWYFELWSGAAPDFDQAVAIAPGAAHTWTERWYPVANLGAIDYANETAALHLDVGREPGTLSVGVAAPVVRPLRGGAVVVLVEGVEIYRRLLDMSLMPGDSFGVRVQVPNSVPAAGLVTLRFLDDQGQVVAQTERWLAIR